MSSEQVQWSFAIHGGAFVIDPEVITTAERVSIEAALRQALLTGRDVLASGGTATDAVEAALVVLEDEPQFNAGKGAVFNSVGSNELDASIMDGANLQSGAVAGVKRVRNPIRAARLVMDRSKHVYLQGDGADEFAESEGLTPVDPDYFYTLRRWNQLLEVQKGARRSDNEKFGTVGAVALDQFGNLAAGTSTGGLTNKRFGRVGDSPIIGAGTYADNRSCAISGTGEGEYFIRLSLAKSICMKAASSDFDFKGAVIDTIDGDLTALGGLGGVIAMSPDGEIIMRFNTQGMYRGRVSSSTEIEVAIYD